MTAFGGLQRGCSSMSLVSSTAEILDPSWARVYVATCRDKGWGKLVSQ